MAKNVLKVRWIGEVVTILERVSYFTGCVPIRGQVGRQLTEQSNYTSKGTTVTAQ